MHERIKELATEVGISIEYLTNTKQIVLIEKFAELIIQECFNVVHEFGVAQVINPEQYLGESLKVSMKITDAAWKINEHFGIEE